MNLRNVHSMQSDGANTYDRLSRLLHWSMALLIGWQMLKFFDRIGDGEHWIGQTLVPWHVSVGTLLMLMIMVRIGWALANRHRRPPQEPGMALAVHAGHALLYLGMLLMPLTGLALMLGNGYGLKVFGVQMLARGDGIAWLAPLATLHVPVAWALLVLVAGHIGMSLLHHFVKRDGVLRRML